MSDTGSPREHESANEDGQDRLGVGISLGVALGVSYGLLTDNLGAGLAIGLGLGVAGGQFFSQNADEDEDESG